MKIFNLFSRKKKDISERHPSDAESSHLANELDLPALLKSVNKVREEGARSSAQIDIEGKAARDRLTAPIESLVRLLETSGVSYALHSLYNSLHALPSIYKLGEPGDNAVAYFTAGIEILDVAELSSRDSNTARIGVKHGDIVYRFEFVREHAIKDEKRVTLVVVSKNDDALISMELYQPIDWDELHHQWLIGGARQFKPGEWMLHMVEIDTKHKLAQKTLSQDWQLKAVSERTRGLAGLD